MKKLIFFCSALLVSLTVQSADDTARLRQLLAAGGAVTIPPGDYFVGASEPLPLTSGMKVEAQGARFHLPEKLGDKARVVVFTGTNVTDFSWHGGEFFGHVFDPARQENSWEPNVCTRMLVIATTPGGVTSNIAFRGVQSHDIAGAVINITGALPAHGERAVLTYASGVTIADCTLLRSGKFMWDYGYLWQQIVWPEDYAPWEVERARRYFRIDLIRDGVQMADGDDCVRFDNCVKPLKINPTNQPHYALCFFGAALPKNIVRGKQYFVVAAAPDHIKVAEQPGGVPIRFAGASGAGAKLIYNLQAAGPSLYAPTGQGPGKGAVDVVGCRNVSITGCTLSALGDTMHLQRSQDAVFSHNHITGSRMGAFFIAEFCQRVTAASNTVDGSNGSRVMSVEKSATDIAIIGNTFLGGGRGSWINQPHNLLIQGNVFSNNTTKCEHDPRRGRRSFATGDYEHYAEMYFTTYEPGGRYGNVVLRDNVFVTGPEATHAITFAPGGENILITNNTFRGSIRT
ncbi:MAG: right-handed parallel beta-helix repeat-containing protein, partial [Kiritimatiellaeota bacterium]|nr:right-handed parallel beta-helix repeat-containing protein [Kiritimatiellota bacterium]